MSYSQTKARNEAFPSVVDCAWKINAIVQVLSENVDLFTQY